MALKEAVSRKIMLMAGILAVGLILLSQAFEPETNSYLSSIKKDRKDKTEQEAPATTLTNAPSDAVPSPAAAPSTDADSSVIREVGQDEEAGSPGFKIDFSILGRLFSTFFRSVISPQAP